MEVNRVKIKPSILFIFVILIVGFTIQYLLAPDMTKEVLSELIYLIQSVMVITGKVILFLWFLLRDNLTDEQYGIIGVIELLALVVYFSLKKK